MEKNRSDMHGYAADDIGASKTRSYEDRSFFGYVKTKGGLGFTLAIVADGVGGGSLGQRAAELTITTIVKKIQSSTQADSEIPQILGAAIGAANKEVYREASSEKNKQGMSSTVSVAVIYKRKLYIANVGDSRIYLISEDKAKQITIDHTFANEKIRNKVLTPEKAHAHPKADYITRSVGFEPQVLVDLGLYLGTGFEDGGLAYSNQGHILAKGDVVLLCSDGLIKEQFNNRSKHYVEAVEIVDTIGHYHAEEAAKVLVDLAVGRNVDDNVTAIVIEFAGRNIRRVNRKKAVLLSGVSLLLVIALIFFIARLRGVSGTLNDMQQASINQTETSTGLTQTAAAFTPTPTPTERPPLVSGEIGVVIDNSGTRQIVFAKTPIVVQSFSEVHVNHTGELQDGLIYLLEGSKILFEADPSNEMNFVMFPESELFVFPGRYTEGAGVRIAEAKGTVDFSVSGSCMALSYTGDYVISSCYEGNCDFQIDYGNKVSIPLGQQVTLDVNTLEIVITGERIPLNQLFSWASVLPRGSNARNCVTAWIPLPTPTHPPRTLKPPEPTVAPPEPTAVPPEPTAVPPEPTAVPPEPTAVPPEPTAVPPEPTAVPSADRLPAR